VEDDEVHESKRRFAKALREYTENVLARDRVIDKLAETDRKLEKVDEKLKAYSLLKEGEQNELDAERTRLKREADTLRAELHKLRSAFEEASVPLTSALRRSIQRSWTGEFGK
jgi:DNA-binding transcriptional MerR regulator